MKEDRAPLIIDKPPFTKVIVFIVVDVLVSVFNGPVDVIVTIVVIVPVIF